MLQAQSKLLTRSYAQSMLMREFITDCLYNKEHGYFSKNVNIFNSQEPIAFNALKDQDDYSRTLKNLYTHCETNAAKNSTNTRIDINAQNRSHKTPTYTNTFNQLWHTPSELFKPFYGAAIVNFLLSGNGNDNLVIYEIGPGNGTLAENILGVLREKHPRIYAKTEYNLVEISDQLKKIQTDKLQQVHGARVRSQDIEILNMPEDFKEERPCWVIGMEVLDNLAHDLIKFRNEDGAVMEATVNIDPQATYGSFPGKYWQEFKVAKDESVLEYVSMGDGLDWKWASLKGNSLRRVLERFSPVAYVNPWSCEFIPTASLKLLKSLTRLFPKHQVLFSDFDELPDTVMGHGGPVVQTRFRGQTVPCSTVLLKPGLFDIFFPTNFERLSQLHHKLRRSNATESAIIKHAEFLKKWSDPLDLKRTTTKSGYNPMLQDFENVSFYYQINK